MACVAVAQAVATARLGPPQTELDGHLTRRHVDDQHGNEEGAQTVCPALEHDGVFGLDRVYAPNSRPDQNTDLVSVFLFQIHLGIVEGLFGGHDGKLDKPVHVPQVFAVDECQRVKIFDLAGYPAGKFGRVKSCDRPETGFAFAQGFPKIRLIVSAGRKNSHSCDNYSSTLYRHPDFPS